MNNQKSKNVNDPKQTDTLSQFEKLLMAENEIESRPKYLRIKQVTEQYGISRPTLDKIAKKIGAKHKVGGVALINVKLLDEYMNECRIPGSEETEHE